MTHNPDNFIQLNGALFEDVQHSGIFSDSKTFVDSIPKTGPGQIRKLYKRQKDQPHFNLKAFVYEHFSIPKDSPSGFEAASSMDEHIEQLWDYLSRPPDSGVSRYSTLLPLPYPYIVPGGRFREIYYWDTYFTAEGLAASGRIDIVENLAKNFAYLIEETGHVPNGNRQYYVSRSQPPFFVMLLDLLAREKGEDSIKKYIPALEKEYAFRMDGAQTLSGDNPTHRRVVRLKDGSVLNRYRDDRPLPREESWREDYELGKGLNEESARKVYRHLRAGAESGWDYTSRWFRDEQSMKTIRTTAILPVDLNALLWFAEHKLAEWTSNDTYRSAEQERKSVFDRIFWNGSSGYYFDYHWPTGRQTETWSLAGACPLFPGLASQDQAEAVAENLEQKFLKDGGLVSTLHHTGQQWDYPNGWAPLQWIAVKGLLNYGIEDLAQTIAERWLKLNEQVFNRTGRMMEKYNVCDLSLEAGGGEYPLQDGFGWTNGVAAALKKLGY